MNLKSYILARLQESSTWRGLILLATAAGATLSPEQAAAIVSFGLALAGAVAVFFADKSQPQA